MGDLVFILGGARSGKTRLALQLARAAGGSVLYVATAELLDEEMRERARRHRAERPPEWRTLEEPLDLLRSLLEQQPFEVCVLDCVTLWVSNLLLSATRQREPAAVDVEALLSPVADLVAWQRAAGMHLIAVSNQVGDGLVPDNPLGRAYRDALGRANQLLAQASDRFYHTFAGYYLDIKALGGLPVDHLPPARQPS